MNRLFNIAVFAFILMSSSFTVLANVFPVASSDEYVAMTNPNKTYKFTHKYSYEIAVTENGESKTLNMEILVPTQKNPQYIGMVMPGEAMMNAQIIFDHELNSMVMLADDKSGTIMSFDMIKQFMPPQAQMEIEGSATDASVKATGKTGSHMGFEYQEFALESQEANGKAWISTDGSLNIFKLFLDMGGFSQSSAFSATQFDQFDGLILSTNMTTADGSTTAMLLVGNDKVDQTISTADYQLMDMSAMMGK